MSQSNKKGDYQACGIIVVPLRIKDNFDFIKKTTLSEIDTNELKKTKQTISSLALFNHASILLKNISRSDTADAMGIKIYDLSAKLRQEFKNKTGVPPITVAYQEWDNTEKIFKSKETKEFSFSWKDNKKEENAYSNEWGKAKLIVFPLSNIAFVTLPVETEKCNGIEEIYTLFNKLSVTIGYENMKLAIDNETMCSMPSFIERLVPEIREGSISYMSNKSLVSFIYVSNPDLIENEQSITDIDKNEIKKCACKLAYTSDLKGFVVDEHVPFIQMLDSDPKLYASASFLGASYVTAGQFDYRKAQRKLNSTFWVFLILLIQRYSLIDILYDLSRTNAQNNMSFSKTRSSYKKMCKIKASLLFTDISDRYDVSRLYHMFAKGLKIDELYEEVTLKLNTLNQYLTQLNDEKSGKLQTFITWMLVILTLTSGLNDLLDIVEDSNRWLPGGLALILVGWILYRNRNWLDNIKN